MKTSNLCNLLILAFFVAVVSCNTNSGDVISDNSSDIDSENTFTFSYTVFISDISGEETPNAKDLEVETLSDKDRVTKIEYGSSSINIEIESQETDEASIHSHVLTWKYENETVTDSITFEIERSGNVIEYKSIWVNNSFDWSIGGRPEIPHIRLLKLSPEYIGLRDENSTDSRIEKDMNGLKFAYWLSDMDGNETNIFNKSDVDERGLDFNFSITNNTDYPIMFENADITLGRYALDMGGYRVRGACNIEHGALIEYILNPGETHHMVRWWCTSEYMFGNVLPAGKYFTYFRNERFKIPPIFINFEIK